MNDLNASIIDLVNIKSIVTIVMSVTYCYLAIMGKIEINAFAQTFTTIVVFYFGTQHEKNRREREVKQ